MGKGKERIEFCKDTGLRVTECICEKHTESFKVALSGRRAGKTTTALLEAEKVINNLRAKIDIWHKPEDKLPREGEPILFYRDEFVDDCPQLVLRQGDYCNTNGFRDISGRGFRGAYKWCYESDLIKTIGGKV